MARTEFTEAVVLRSVAYGDADRIVTLLTASHGKIAVLARSARKSIRRFGAALEPCALIEAEVAIGKGEVGRIAQARVVRAFPGVLADLVRIGVATAGIELVRETIGDREPDARLIPTLVRFFEIAERSADPGVLVSFSIRILALTGHAPNMTTCGKCGREAPENKAALYDAGTGAVVCRACGGGPIKISGALRGRLLRATTKRWDEEATASWTGPELVSARDVLRETVRRHLPRELVGSDWVAQVHEVSTR